MARSKLSQRNVRKLTRVGRFSMSVTLPREMIDFLHWREKQKVVVRRVGKKLIIEDWKK
jgi:virulence-associated protein VagC